MKSAGRLPEVGDSGCPPRRGGTGHLTIVRRGYYPKGGGELTFETVTGADPPAPLALTVTGSPHGIAGVSHAAAILEKRQVAHRQAVAAQRELAPLGVPVQISVEYRGAYSPGSGVTLWTESPAGVPLGGSALGARGKLAEAVGQEAARVLRREIESGAAADRYLADQLIPFLAVRGGELVTSEVTRHTTSNIHVARAVTGTAFEVIGNRIVAKPPR